MRTLSIIKADTGGFVGHTAVHLRRRPALVLSLDGPPRVVCPGYQVTGGRLIGPRDMFDDPAVDRTRRQAEEIMDYLRRHGPFEPHRLPLEETEYTTMPQVAARLADCWEPIAKPAPAIA